MVNFPKAELVKTQHDLKYQVKKRLETEEKLKESKQENWALQQEKNKLYFEK